MPVTGTPFASTVGGAVMVTVICAEPVTLPESVTEAVIVWVPIERLEVAKEPPVPMAPLIDEVQDRLAVRLPSSRSLAVPVKVIEVPEPTLVPVAGAVMATAGALLPPPTGMAVSQAEAGPMQVFEAPTGTTT